MFLKANPIAIVSTPPIHRLENRIKIPKPTLKHHRQRTGAGVVPINIGPNPTSTYHRTRLFRGRFVHIMCTAFGRWMRTSTHRSPPLFIFHIFGVPEAGNRAHLVLSLFFDRWRIPLAGLYRQRFTLLRSELGTA